MEVRKLLRRATAIPPRRGHYFDENEPAQNRVYKSLKVGFVLKFNFHNIIQKFSVEYTTQVCVNALLFNLINLTFQIWSLYADVEEATGTFESCKAVYERMIDLQIVTPQIILNFANFLEENNYFEHSFKVLFFISIISIIFLFCCYFYAFFGIFQNFYEQILKFLQIFFIYYIQ